MTFWVSNKFIPLNDRKKGEIADIAKQQLRRFQNAADTWPLIEHKHDARLGWCCRMCDKTIYFSEDTGEHPYVYSPADIKTLIVAHIRQCHADIVAENGEIISEYSRKSEVLDIPGRAFPAGFDSSNAHRPVYQDGDSRGIEFT